MNSKNNQPLTHERFLTQVEEHGNWYSTFLLLNVTIEQVINAINALGLHDPSSFVSAGIVEGKHVWFQGMKVGTQFIIDLTAFLHTIGYSDETWQSSSFFACKNGIAYDGYTARWDEDMPCNRGEDNLWDAFFTITDKETGAKFHTGCGATDWDTVKEYGDLINAHLL